MQRRHLVLLSWQYPARAYRCSGLWMYFHIERSRLKLLDIASPYRCLSNFHFPFRDSEVRTHTVALKDDGLDARLAQQHGVDGLRRIMETISFAHPILVIKDVAEDENHLLTIVGDLQQ